MRFAHASRQKLPVYQRGHARSIQTEQRFEQGNLVTAPKGNFRPPPPNILRDNGTSQVAKHRERHA
ncbi:MAG: hypothetical protein AAGH67_15390 [Cyanobacteria bacterium P01_H01_bin.162]